MHCTFPPFGIRQYAVGDTPKTDAMRQRNRQVAEVFNPERSGAQPYIRISSFVAVSVKNIWRWPGIKHTC